jgi:hypothetical protein
MGYIETAIAGISIIAIGSGIVQSVFPKLPVWIHVPIFGALFVLAVKTVNKYNLLEYFGNYGPKCPNGYIMTSTGDCKPVGHATYPAVPR